jgi:hypothetical protein
MKPVLQDKFGKPDGNCFAACIASILEIRLHDVPAKFYGTGDWGNDSDKFFAELNEWLSQFGLSLMTINCEDPEKHLPEAWLIIGGMGPRGIEHCIVGWKNEERHDPHPDGGGLTAVDCWYIFIPRDAAEVRRRYKKMVDRKKKRR